MIDFPNTITVALSGEDAKDYIHTLETNGQSDCFALKVDDLEDFIFEKLMKDGYLFVCVIYMGLYVVFALQDFFAVYDMLPTEIDEQYDPYTSTSAVEAYVQAAKMSKNNKNYDKEDVEKKRIAAMLYLAVIGACVAIEESKVTKGDLVRKYDPEPLIKKVSMVATEINGEKVEAFPIYTSSDVAIRSWEEGEHGLIFSLPLEDGYLELVPQSYIVINPGTVDFVISKESLKEQLKEMRKMSKEEKYETLGFDTELDEDWPFPF